MGGCQESGRWGSAGFQPVRAGRLQEAQSPFGLSELVSGQAGPALALAEWPSGPTEEPFGLTGRLLGLAGLQRWFGSWGSASLSSVQIGSL